jgi:hypothetical protein
MVFTSGDLQATRDVIEARSGMDVELARECGPLIGSRAAADGVRRAFVVLEQRLHRTMGGAQGTGAQMSKRAFEPSTGPLSRRLAMDSAQQEGLRDLFVGAFQLLRNPVVHAGATYDLPKAKAIISYVNLLLMLLDEIPPPAAELPANLKGVVEAVASAVDPSAGRRLHVFLQEYLRMGLQTNPKAVEWAPFRTQCVCKSREGATPRRRAMTVFHVILPQRPQLRVEVYSLSSCAPVLMARRWRKSSANSDSVRRANAWTPTRTSSL